MPGPMHWIKPLFFLLVCWHWMSQQAYSQARRHERQIQRLQQQQSKQLAYRFVVAGDNRDGNTVLRRLLRRAVDFHPVLMLHSGDFVALGQRHEYLQLFHILDQAPFPVFLALGNHDA